MNRLYESIFDETNDESFPTNIAVGKGEDLTPSSLSQQEIREEKFPQIESLTFEGAPGKSGTNHSFLPDNWLSAYVGNLDEVDLPAGLWGIGANAFGRIKIGTLRLPTSVRLIKRNAFKKGQVEKVVLYGPNPESFFDHLPGDDDSGASTLGSGLDDAEFEMEDEGGAPRKSVRSVGILPNEDMTSGKSHQWKDF